MFQTLFIFSWSVNWKQFFGQSITRNLWCVQVIIPFGTRWTKLHIAIWIPEGLRNCCYLYFHIEKKHCEWNSPQILATSLSVVLSNMSATGGSLYLKNKTIDSLGSPKPSIASKKREQNATVHHHCNPWMTANCCKAETSKYLVGP